MKIYRWMTCAALSLATPLFSVDWSDGAANNNWSDGANWAGGSPPGSFGPATFPEVPGAGPVVIDTAGLVCNLIDFSSTTIPYTISGPNSLDINSGTVNISGGPLTHTINTDLTSLTGFLAPAGAAGNTLVLGGNNSALTAVLIQTITVAVGADNNLGAPGSGIFLDNNNTTLRFTATFPCSHFVNLNTGGPNIEVDSGVTLTMTNPITGAAGTTLEKSGDGTLVLSGLSTFDQGINIEGGVLQVNIDDNLGPMLSGMRIANGTTFRSTGTFATSKTMRIDTNPFFDVTTNETLTLNGSLSNLSPSSGFTKIGGGTLVLGGAVGTKTYDGQTTVNGGTLFVNTSIPGDVQVNAGTLLGGTGSIGGDVTNDGNVGPGTSIGTLTIVGNYVQNAGANLDIEINPSGATDLLDVNGTATIDGSVTVLPEPGIYMTGQTFDFLTTGGGLTGQFSNLIEAHAADFQLNYLPLGAETFAQLEIIGVFVQTPTPTTDLSGNALRVANYIFCPDPFPTDNSDFVSAINALLSNTPDDFKKGLINLSPAQYGALPLQNLNKDVAFSDAFVDRIEERMWCDRCNNATGQKSQTCQDEVRRTSMWTTILGVWQKQDGIQEQYAFHDQTYGFTIGASHLFTNHLFLSGGVGYTYSDLHWQNNKGSSDTNAVYVAPSIGYSQDNYFVNLLGQFAANWNNVDRKIQYPGLTRTANSEFTTYDLLVRLDGGYKFTLKDSTGKDGPFLFVPEARLSYLNVWQESFKEKGASSLKLNVKSKTTSYLQPEVLLKILKEYYVGEGCVIPMIKAGYIAKVPLSSSTYKATLDVIDCSSDMSVKSFDWTSNQLMLGTGLTYKTLEHFSAGFDYEAHLFDKSLVQDAKIRFDYSF